MSSCRALLTPPRLPTKCRSPPGLASSSTMACRQMTLYVVHGLCVRRVGNTQSEPLSPSQVRHLAGLNTGWLAGADHNT